MRPQPNRLDSNSSARYACLRYGGFAVLKFLLSAVVFALISGSAIAAEKAALSCKDPKIQNTIRTYAQRLHAHNVRGLEDIAPTVPVADIDNFAQISSGKGKLVCSANLKTDYPGYSIFYRAKVTYKDVANAPASISITLSVWR